MTVSDCVGNITSGDVVQSWLGDGYCDDGTYGLDLNCAEFNYDNGDCLGSGGVQATAMDCVGNITSLSQIQAWLGDGYCDDGTYGLVLNCAEYNYDYGDCGVATGGAGSNTAVMDCVGNITSMAQIQAWLGDGYCDDGTYGLVLNCPQYNYDYGDCSYGGSMSIYPGNSCGVDGVYDCNNNCVSVGDVMGIMSDGWCDSGTYNINLDCPQFNYEGGDCNYILY